MNENDADLIKCIDFINETKQLEEENQKPQPTEITIIDETIFTYEDIADLWYRIPVGSSYCDLRLYWVATL